jgi:hypothetical protein
MRLIELKVLKENKIYKRILDELKLKGLNNLYINKTKTIDHLDVIIGILDFLEQNKKILKGLTEEQYENITVIIIDEIFEKLEFEISEESIEKILKLLKNSILVKRASKFLIDKLRRIKFFCCFSKKEMSAVSKPVALEIKQIEENTV